MKRGTMFGYFSVSHLIQSVFIDHEDGRKTKLGYIAIRGKEYKGKVRWQALGGGAKLTPTGIRYLKEKYGNTIRFRNGEESDDVRFYLPIPQQYTKQERDMFILETLLPFTFAENRIEWSVMREVRAELKKNIPTLPVEKLWASEHSLLSPIKWPEVGSGRSDGAILYERVFHVSNLYVPEAIWPIMTNSPSIRILSKDDINRMYQASQKGISMTPLADGSVIAENVFPW